ncbi:hypothetical protein BDR26DRAFT_785843, partial [Obelidium mucronatum]
TPSLKKPVLPRRYPCQIPGCDKVFQRRYHMVSHLATHTAFKPFSCSEKGCTSSFRRPQDLKRHLR